MGVPARAPTPAEVNADGYVILPSKGEPEPPPARAERERTHCRYGHGFTLGNTLITATGRRCRVCLSRSVLPPNAQPIEVAAGVAREAQP